MYDNRMNSLRNNLIEAGYEVIEGNNQQDINLSAKVANTLDGIVLPIQGVEDNGQMKMQGETYNVNELFQNLSSKCIIFAGLKRNYMDALTNKIIYMFSEEAVMVPNAILAAEGLLHQMIAYTDRSIFEYKVDIIGYGHVGSAMADILTKLKISVKMIITRPLKWSGEKNIILNGQNVAFEMLEEWKQEEPAGIIIITVPIEVIDEEISEIWEKRPLVIDMAKGRQGVSENAANSGKMILVKAPALPALAAPDTAGTILADYIISVTNEQGK